VGVFLAREYMAAVLDLLTVEGWGEGNFAEESQALALLGKIPLINKRFIERSALK